MSRMVLLYTARPISWETLSQGLLPLASPIGVDTHTHTHTHHGAYGDTMPIRWNSDSDSMLAILNQ